MPLTEPPQLNSGACLALTEPCTTPDHALKQRRQGWIQDFPKGGGGGGGGGLTVTRGRMAMARGRVRE